MLNDLETSLKGPAVPAAARRSPLKRSVKRFRG
jgi:hypothetical protein